MAPETKGQRSISHFFKSQSSSQKLNKDDTEDSGNIIDLTNGDEKVSSRLANFEHKPNKSSKSPNELDTSKRKSSKDNEHVDGDPEPVKKKPRTSQSLSRSKSKPQSVGSNSKKLTPLEKQFVEMTHALLHARGPIERSRFPTGEVRDELHHSCDVEQDRWIGADHRR